MAPAVSRALSLHLRPLAALAAAALAIGLVAVPSPAGAAAAQVVTQPGAGRYGTGPYNAELAEVAQRARAVADHGGAQPSLLRSGTITGVVLGPRGMPLAGACVTAVGRPGSVTATAAPTGEFTIGRLAPGSYALEYRDCGGPTRYFPRWSGGASWPSAAEHILITAGQVRTVPPMMLRPVSPAALLPRAQSWHRMLVAAEGRTLSAAAAAKTGQIAGVITGKGHKLRGICVTVFRVQGGIGYGATSAKNGSYTVRHLPAGSYDVTFADQFFCPSDGNWLQQSYPGHNNPFGLGAAPVKVSAGKTTSGIDASLRLGGEISGTVRARSGRKLGGICVTENAKISGGYEEGFAAQTSRNGTYSLHALFPGTYSLDFSIGCGFNGNYAPKALRPIRIRYGQRVTGADATLARGGIVTGTVRLGSSTGKPLPGICVYASNSDGSINSNTSTKSNGSYRVVGLGTGDYQLQFQPGCSNQGNYVSAFTYAHATEGRVTSGVDAVLQPGAEISGTVTGVHSTPVSGICIELIGDVTDSIGVPQGTDQSGSYVINQLAAGTYRLGFSGGCGNSGSYAPYWYDNQTDQSLATPITLATGSSRTINAQLQPGGTLTGTVTDSRGHKLSGVCVYVATPLQALLGRLFQADTGTNRGTYQIANLEPGQYLVDFGCGLSTRYADQWFPNAPDPGSAELVSVSAGQTSGVNAVLQPGGTISGVVIGKLGRPMPNVCVQAINTTSRSGRFETIGGPGQVLTDARGRYQIQGLPAGSYDVIFSLCQEVRPRYSDQWYRGQASQLSANPVKVRSGAITSGISARMTIGGTISGRVVGATGKPLNNICVLAYNFSTAQFGFGQTGKTGTYSVVGVSTGSYTVEFMPCDSQVNLVTVLAHAKVVAPKATTGVNARLRPGGSVAGTITAANSGSPVANTCAEVISANPANAGGVGISSANGSYLVTGLAPGAYQVYFGDPLCFLATPDLAPQWYDDQPTKATATTITVSAGKTTPAIDAALQPDGSITGTVLGPSSTPVGGACVTAMPLIPGSLPIVAVSRSSGGYTLADLVPGRYKVEFSAGCGTKGYRTQWWPDATSRAAATVIVVSAGQTVSGIDATLSR